MIGGGGGAREQPRDVPEAGSARREILPQRARSTVRGAFRFDSTPRIRIRFNAFFTNKALAMQMYAVVKTGGKQYRVSPGENVKVELLPNDVGSEVVLGEVLFVGGEGDVKVGKPRVA